MFPCCFQPCKYLGRTGRAAGFYHEERERRKRPSLVETGLCAHSSARARVG